MRERSPTEAAVMRLDWSFNLDHSAQVQAGERQTTLVEQNEAWHLRIKYASPIIAGEHWDVLIAWSRRYTPSFTAALKPGRANLARLPPAPRARPGSCRRRARLPSQIEITKGEA
jgi:hypothetical protein